MIKWQGINEFVAVAETQSFSAAAKKLNISTAQVSRQITALEKRLQVKLFYRTTRKVSLTQESELYYQHCRHLLDDLDAAEQAITNLHQYPQGKIKLTTPITYGEQRILPLVNDFVAMYNEIEVYTELTNHQVDLIEGGFDLAIRTGQLPDSSLMASPLSKRASYICASASYIEKYGSPRSLSELSEHNCLLGLKDHWKFVDNGKRRSIKVRGNLRYNSALGLVDAAVKGLGLVQISDYYVKPYIESGQLVRLLSDFTAPAETIWAVYPQNRYLAPKIRLLVDFLAKHL